MPFYVGQEVYCVDDSFKGSSPSYKKFVIRPVKGTIYKVREVRSYNNSYIEGTIILLEEIKNRCMVWVGMGYVEQGYLPHWFRPVEKQTNISELEEFLTNPNKEIVEEINI